MTIETNKQNKTKENKTKEKRLQTNSHDKTNNNQKNQNKIYILHHLMPKQSEDRRARRKIADTPGFCSREYAEEKEEERTTPRC